ncbi:MAG: hypothetical protein VX460_15210 [Planctomycetota bacterium]|nr:hypothetical protein [Planctomycetota bacterium]
MGAETRGRAAPAAGGASPEGGSEQLFAVGRGCAGTVVSGGCGCGAFLVGAVLAVVLFAPQLMAGWGTRLLEQQIGAQLQGAVSVGDMTLSWTEQQRADSVTILDEAGNLVLQGGMRMPSLLELADPAGRDQEFVFDVQLLKSRIDADGTSNLGRTFGVTAEAGGSVAPALMRWAVEFFTAARFDAVDGAMTVRLELAEAEIDDTASGRGTVRLRDLSIRASRSASGLRVRLDRGEIVVGGRSVPVTLSASFGPSGAGGALELVRAELDAAGLSSPTLATLGMLPRSDGAEARRDPRLVRDVYDRAAPVLIGAASALIVDADSIKARFGVPREALAGALPRLRVEIAGPRGALDFEADLSRGDGTGPLELVPPPEGGRARFVLEAPGLLVPAVAAAAPAGARVVALETSGAAVRVTARLRDFVLPLDRDLLQLDASARRGVESAVDRLARSLRRGRGELSVAGGDAVRLDVGPEGSGDGRLEARHALTNVSFDEDGSGTFLSRWRHLGPGLDPGAAPRFSTVEGALPTSGAAIDGEPGALRMDVHGVPLALLAGVFPVDQRVTRLVGARLQRLQLEGLDAGVLIGRAPRTTPLDVEVLTAADDRLTGTVSEDGFLVRRARIGLLLDEAVIHEVMKPLLPWVEELRPLDPETPGKVDLELVRFVFPASAQGGGMSGQLRAELPPLEARLPASLLRDLRIEHDQRWVLWEPTPIDVALDRAGATYTAAELPLGGGRAVRLSGTSRGGRYNLGGTVAPTILRNLGGQSVDEDARVRIEISNQGDAERPRVLVSPAEFVTAIEEIIDLLNPENRSELLDYLRGN